MIIDKMGSVTYTEGQLRKKAQREINTKWRPADEANIQRILLAVHQGVYTLSAEEQANINKYEADLLGVQSDMAQAEIDNQLLIDTIAYENAEKRLAKYQLSAGRPEQDITELSPDPDTGELVPVVVGKTKVIEALPAQIMQKNYDTDGNYTGEGLVDNPRIVKDDQERATAQAVIDAASAEVLALAVLRAG